MLCKNFTHARERFFFFDKKLVLKFRQIYQNDSDSFYTQFGQIFEDLSAKYSKKAQVYIPTEAIRRG